MVGVSQQETLLGCSSVPEITMVGNNVLTMDMHINLCSSHQVSYLLSYLHCNHLHSIPTYDTDSLIYAPQGISKHGRTERATLLVYINSCLCNYVEAFIDHWTTSYDHCETTGLFDKMVQLTKCSLKECYKY